MTADQAREIVGKREAVDNSATVFMQINNACNNRKHSVEVSTETMTAGTIKTLKASGFEISSNERGYNVSW